MSMKKSALIFGVNGFVGSYLVRELIDNGYEVHGSDRAADSPIAELSAFRTGDITDAEIVEAIIHELAPDVIVNLAAISSVGLSWRCPQATMAVNVVGPVNILQAAASLDRMPKVLLIGSSEEYAPSALPVDESAPINASSPYGVSKIAQENMANLYADRFGIPIYKVRAFNHTGVGQADSFVLPSWCKQIAAMSSSGTPGIIRVGNTDVVRDFSDVRDIVRAYRMLIESDKHGEVFNIGSGVGYSLSELLDRIISLSDCPVEAVGGPGLLRPTGNPGSICDNSKVKHELGWSPEHSIDDLLRSMYEDFHDRQNR